jgi:UDP-glucose 4-epimerase
MVAQLTAQGHEAIVYDNLSKGHLAAIGDAAFVKGDLADYELLVRTLKECRIEAVMHFAAFIEAGESAKKPLEFYRNNVANTRVLLAAMEAVGIDQLVFSSTAAVYGIPQEVPITEKCPTKPINPYGETKLAVEKMCHHQGLTGRLRYATLRYFNACGAGEAGKLGEDHQPETHLIPLAIMAAMGERDNVSILGTDYETADGTCIRDYIHVEDLCQAHLLALEKLQSNVELIYNLGNGKGYSVREVIETVKRVSGCDFPVVEADRREGDPPVLTSDATKAKEELEWEPQITELEKIVETAWQWHNDYPAGYPD